MTVAAVGDAGCRRERVKGCSSDGHHDCHQVQVLALTAAACHHSGEHALIAALCCSFLPNHHSRSMRPAVAPTLLPLVRTTVEDINEIHLVRISRLSDRSGASLLPLSRPAAACVLCSWFGGRSRPFLVVA